MNSPPFVEIWGSTILLVGFSVVGVVVVVVVVAGAIVRVIFIFLA